MAQNDKAGSKASDSGNAQEEMSGSPSLRTRVVIKDNFKRTRDLTTIQLHDTILFKDGDCDQGAAPFIILMTDLVGDKGSNTAPFDAKWLVTDSKQLQHVLRETKARAKSVFDTLVAHATVAVIGESNEHLPLLTKTLPAIDQGKQRTLTAFSSEAGAGYNYYGHFEPSAGQDWRNGPLCTLLSNAPGELDSLLVELQKAHVENREYKRGKTVERLEKSGISILSLEDLIN